ncbi:DUF2786 domain-containing protein [Streptomyces sp. NPDC048483]|uniref:DUF2786 domain-containing protein n=1 Tax=Streptomyces sp. NPDC048483 TaxID=3154927 RepID=UPI0034131B91
MTEHGRSTSGGDGRRGGTGGTGGRRGRSGRAPSEAEELVGGVLGSVRYAADGAAAEDAVEAGASMLAAAPAGWEAVSAAVVAAAADGVAQCWAGGWQPADLERYVRREAADAPLVALVVDAIAAEAARHPAARTPRGTRWTEQLRRLGAEVWWESGPGYLDALAARRRTTRFETAYAVLMALRALARVPRITPLPAPPTAPARKAHSAAASRALGRIRGLLAKAEATNFAEEAEALSAKAQELMARHSIDEALLDSGSPEGATDGPSAIRIGIEGPYEQAKALLLDAVAAANRCQAVWAADIGFSTLIGFEADLEATELLYTSLLLQATTAMHRAADALPQALKEQAGAPVARGRSRRTRDFRQTFLIAYADRIRTRLTEATEAATTAATSESPHTAPDLLPVLAARELAVEETTATLFPDTAPVRLRGVRDADGWHAGRAAADRARLGEGE